MSLPFGREQFFNVFSEYNTALWPIQLFVLAYGLIIFILALTGRSGASIGTGLGVLWIWMGVMYHIAFFSTINSAAFIFGGLFVIQGAYFIIAAKRLHFGEASTPQHIAGISLAVYGVILYPLVGLVAGQVWPAMPVFSLPCPTVIFTFGVLCLAGRSVPLTLLLIPTLWAVIGTSAALTLDVPGDFGLPIAAVITVMVLVAQRRSHAVQAAA